MNDRTGSTARSVALEAIRRVIDEHAYSTLVLPALLRRARLDARDRAFATELAYGTLRRRIPIDRSIGMRSTRPIERIDPRVLHVLRLGAYQLASTSVPSYAAVAETVSLATGRERGFVNAILRRLAGEPVPAPAGRGPEDVAARTGLIPWAVAELEAVVGPEAEDAAAAFARRGPLCLRTNTARIDVGSLERALRGAGLDPRPASLDPACLLLDGGDPTTLPGYRDGWFAVQDQASAFVVRVLDPGPGDRIADVCAAPGGKALATAAATDPEGIVVAADRSERRVALIARQAARLGVRPALVVQDSTAPAVHGPFDRVVVDAPCSGIGSARRRPELLWRVDRGRLAALGAQQLRLLEVAADLLRDGGRLVYSVCTFPRAETDAVCDELLRIRRDLVPVVTEGPDGDAERHRLWPHRHGSDGMFVAVFRRAR
jgi:16S rRNA (cytosine967-C5)-methyltransferase